MRQVQATLTVQTPGRALVPVTAAVQRWVAEVGARDGLVSLFLLHTSASLLVQENADPSVREDLERFFSRLVPDGDPAFTHDAEGPDDMPAHVRAALTQVQLTIPVAQGRLVLGTWQGLYLYEHRRSPHTRSIHATFLGEM